MQSCLNSANTFQPHPSLTKKNKEPFPVKHHIEESPSRDLRLWKFQSFPYVDSCTCNVLVHEAIVAWGVQPDDIGQHPERRKQSFMGNTKEQQGLKSCTKFTLIQTLQQKDQWMTKINLLPCGGSHKAHRATWVIVGLINFGVSIHYEHWAT